MKVLNVSYTLDDITGGGVAERSSQLSKYLSLFGADVCILTIDTGVIENRKKLFAKTKLFVLPCLLKRFYVPKTSLSEIKKIVSDVDVVHMMGHWTILNVLIYLAVRAKKKPYAVCPAGSLKIYGRSKLFKSIYDLIIGKAIIKNATFLIAITEDERQHFIPYGVENKVKVIPNGISQDEFESNDTTGFRQKYNLSDRPFILFLGRLNYIKGPDLLLKAFEQIKDLFPNFDLVFAGPDDGLMTELKMTCANFNLNTRVHFIGHIGGADKSNAYFTSELLVIPSRQEAMSIVALEAGICGTPVLLTDECGFDQLSDIGGGWVVPATVEGLKNGLIESLKESSGRKAAGLKIKDYVVANFTWDRIVRNYLSLFTQMLDN